MAHHGEHDARNDHAPKITYGEDGLPDSQPDLSPEPPDADGQDHVEPGVTL